MGVFKNRFVCLIACFSLFLLSACDTFYGGSRRVSVENYAFDLTPICVLEALKSFSQIQKPFIHFFNPEKYYEKSSAKEFQFLVGYRIDDINFYFYVFRPKVDTELRFNHGNINAGNYTLSKAFEENFELLEAIEKMAFNLCGLKYETVTIYVEQF